MKKIVTILLVMSMLFPVVLFAEDEYVFTESELEEFLHEQITEAIEAASAEIIRDCEIDKKLITFELDTVKSEKQIAEERAAEAEKRYTILKYVAPVAVVAGSVAGFFIAKGIYN